MRRVWGLLLAAVCSGCLQSSVVECASGIICPEGTLCDDEHHKCVFQSQLDACKGKPDGEPCTYAGETQAACFSSVCLAFGCGNGVTELDEACDDGNTESGDGCASDCKSDETCGNGTTDTRKQEQCDDGNTTPGDGCGATCRIELCGNGLKDPGEACDDGNNMPQDGCSSDCRSDETCGNGITDVSKDEQCDEGAANSDLPGALCRTDCQLRRCGDGIVDAASGESCEAGQLGGVDCTDFGFYNVAGLACGDACELDTSGCTGFCGDRSKNGDEQCDGKPQSGASCVASGYDEGTLGCQVGCAVDFAQCRSFLRDPWDDVSTGMPSGRVNDLVVFSPSDVIAVGDTGKIMRFNGTSWTSMTSGTSSILWGVWGTSPTNVYAVGNSKTLLHFDGTSWSPITLASGNNFLDVWGSGPSDVFVVGEGGVIWHFDGSTWMTMTSTTTQTLAGVRGTSATNVFAVGANGTILRFNGTTWTGMSSGITDFLADVWVASNTLAFAVGNSSALLRYNGSTWSPSPSGVVEDFNAVWGSGPYDVYAVGGQGTLLHFDGLAWSSLSLGAPASLESVSGGGPGVTFLGGNGHAYRSRATQWVLAPPTGATSYLWAAGGSSAKDLFAVGGSGTVLHFDGTAWTEMASGTTTGLNAVWAFGPSDVYAGGNGGVLRHYDGATWGTRASGTTAGINDFWAASPTSLYAATSAGVWHYDGSTGAILPGTTPATVIWGSGPSDIFSLGGAGAISHYNGVSWTAMTSGTTDAFRGVWGSGPSDVYAVTRNNVYHYNGVAWSAVTVPAQYIYDVWGRGPDDVFVVGEQGLVHYDGTRWAPMKLPTWQPLYGAWGLRDVMVLVGDTGTVIQRGDGCDAQETSCGNGDDEDCDGTIDCGDSDCAADATCAAGGACSSSATVACNQSVAGTTSGGPRNLTLYACSDWAEHGREATYRFDATTTASVTVQLSGATADLDLFVLAEGAGGGCEPRSPGCLAGSSTTNATESVTFAAVAGRTYYVVVDGGSPTTSSFALNVACP